MSERSRRMARVDELLKQEIARIVRDDVRDPRIGFLTILDVETSPDLHHARVWVSVLGAAEEKRASLEALERARGFVRARIGESVVLKYVPELHFELDPTVERAARIDAILDDLRPDSEDVSEA